MIGTTQTQIVLDHLQKYGKITTWEAITEYGITRLGSRIYDLRKDGHKIKSRSETVKTRLGNKTSIAIYELEEQNNEFKK